VSLEVLQEYFVAATRKLGVAPEMAQRKVEILARGRIVRFDARGSSLRKNCIGLRGSRFGDALVVHAARSAGAAVLYSEDLRPGAVLGGVRVVNPFLA